MVGLFGHLNTQSDCRTVRHCIDYSYWWHCYSTVFYPTACLVTIWQGFDSHIGHFIL